MTGPLLLRSDTLLDEERCAAEGCAQNRQQFITKTAQICREGLKAGQRKEREHLMREIVTAAASPQKRLR